MSKVKKLIIPVAGWGTRFLPMTKIIHKELVPILNRPALDLLIDEALEAGIEQIILIISERKKNILDFFDKNELLEQELQRQNKNKLLNLVQQTNRKNQINFIIQHQQLGLGHALAQAKKIINNEPFAVILGDDLIKSQTPAIKQLIQFYEQTQANILGVQSVEDTHVNKYGIVKPLHPEQKNNQYFEIETAVEKPNLDVAPSNKAILGRYVFNPQILEILSQIKYDGQNEIQLVDAFSDLINKYQQKIYAFEFEGTRYDLGSIEGFVKATIDYALANDNIKDSILEYIKLK
nr:UTP--glucose-1-phosphate uridylyltransferase [Mycoplasmopsis phocirhinis]